MKIVRLYNFRVHTILLKVSLPAKDLLGSLRKGMGPDFPENKLSIGKLGSSEDPGYFQQGGATLIRCKVDCFNVIIFCKGDMENVTIEIFRELDHWGPDDPRYKKDLKKMEKILKGIVRDTGFVQGSPLEEHEIESKKKQLQEIFETSKHLERDLAYITTVGLQKIDLEPFIRKDRL